MAKILRMIRNFSGKALNITLLLCMVLFSDWEENVVEFGKATTARIKQHGL